MRRIDLTLSMKALLKKFVSPKAYRVLRFAKRAPQLFRATLYDLKRYAKHSSVVNYDDDEEKLRAIITATYHNIEKGLSLPSPRLGFGRDNLSRLVGYIDECLQRFGPKEYLQVPVSVLGAYVRYHEQHGHDVSVLRGHWQRLEALNASDHVQSPSFGGVIEITREEVLAATRTVSLAFFEKRFSCRQFSSEPITPTQVEIAVRVAQKAPAVCNRQSGRVRAYLDTQDIQRILALQGGARGFAEGVRALFCITTDQRNFHGVGERYQAWIDGGLFGMSFVYGLHMQGIGSCCLNWSKDGDQDLAMRELLKLPDNETIIMFVAAGHLPIQMTVARSMRKPIEEVMHICRL